MRRTVPSKLVEVLLELNFWRRGGVGGNGVRGSLKLCRMPFGLSGTDEEDIVLIIESFLSIFSMMIIIIELQHFLFIYTYW